MMNNTILIKIDEKDIELSTTKITGREILERAKKQEHKLYIVGESDALIENDDNVTVKNDDCFITIPISALEDGVIDTGECAKHDCIPPKGQKKYRIQIDGEKYIVEQPHLLGKEILALAGKTWQEFSLQQKFKGGKREIIKPEQKVDFSTKGVERFETVPKHPQQG